MDRIEDEVLQRAQAFARGEATLAELEGMTGTQAARIAQVGCELAEAGRLSEACEVFEGLVVGNPEDASARAALGSLYESLGHPLLARAQYEAALEVAPRHPVALARRGELRLKGGDAGGRKDLLAAVLADPKEGTLATVRARRLLQGVESGA